MNGRTNELTELVQEAARPPKTLISIVLCMQVEKIMLLSGKYESDYEVKRQEERNVTVYIYTEYHKGKIMD